MSDDAPLLVEESGGVAWLTLNRPERLNALNPALVDALRGYFEGLNSRSSARVVVLQAAGRAFCAGLDIKDHVERVERVDGSDRGQNLGPEAGMDRQHAIKAIFQAMRRCPQPIIGIVQGAAAGGGFTLALACDLRLATPDARFNAAFIRIGLSGCDMGISWFLPRMVGASVASELILTGRFLHAPRALALGLVSQVGELPALQAEARALAADMLGATPLALRMTKECLTHSIDAPSLDAAMAMEDRNQILCAQSGDFREGMAAFLEKRPPAYALK